MTRQHEYLHHDKKVADGQAWLEALPAGILELAQHPCHGLLRASESVFARRIEVTKGRQPGGGGNSLRPYSQRRPMRTNLSCCPGLIGNGQYKSTNRLLVVVPHERSHGIMRILKNLCMLLPKALKMRAIKDTMALVADSIGGTKGAPAQMSWHPRHLNPALLKRQGMSTHPKMENGSELRHWKGQLIMGLCAGRPCKRPQIGAKLGTPRGSTTRRNVKPAPNRHVSG